MDPPSTHRSLSERDVALTVIGAKRECVCVHVWMQGREDKPALQSRSTHKQDILSRGQKNASCCAALTHREKGLSCIPFNKGRLLRGGRRSEGERRGKPMYTPTQPAPNTMNLGISFVSLILVPLPQDQGKEQACVRRGRASGGRGGSRERAGQGE